MTALTRIILFSSISFSLSCGDKGSFPTTPSDLEEPDQVREAVYRYQFLHNESVQQQSAQMYFLSAMVHAPPPSSAVWAHADPSPALMARFDGHQPPVRPWSRCSASVYGVVDTLTGEHGLLFNVNSITVFEGDSATAGGGYFEGGSSASGNTYYLRRIGGSWIVIYDVLHWISTPPILPDSLKRLRPS